VVAGARDDRREDELRRLLSRFTLVRFDAPTHFDGAVRVDRACRAAGVTPRGLVDCMIVAVAVAHDADFARIATAIDLRLDEASPRP
jgi:hypothetical protein